MTQRANSIVREYERERERKRDELIAKASEFAWPA
jgi:hypothetical protein